MTVIAFDGKTLAADKQCTAFGYAHIVTKIHRVPGGLVGFTGNSGHAAALLAWFRDSRPVENWPKAHDESAGAIFVCETGEVLCYSGTDGPYGEKREDKFMAFGCGRDYALAAMYLGKTAAEAVEIACALDVNCGMGIDTLEL